VRTTQLASIYRAFVQTGEWLEADESCVPEVDLEFHHVDHRSVRKLKRYDDEWFVSLCDEGSYNITVDTHKIRVPHVVNYNSVLVESQFHPNSLDRSVKPYLITDENIKFVGDLPLTFPIFIPTVPQFLDSCLNCIRGRRSRDDTSCALPQMDMDNLFRYLVLDSPSQQDKLLSSVTNLEQLAEYFTERRLLQAKRVKRIMERRAKCQRNATTALEAQFFMPPL